MASSRGGLGRLGRASGLGLGIATIWLSILVLIPLAAVLAKSSGLGWSGFWSVISTPEVESALKLTVVEALLVTVVNIVMGTLVAWVLVRDDFVGRRIFEVVIDLPFALPTIVAGLVLLSLYGTNSPVHVILAQSRAGVFLALLFVTLPFVVRTVQPVLIELDRDMEEAAASLGASRFTTFRRIILPNL
ncbi:MAG TPA: ABC transporter permease subunit, partial [Acidimicrobiales bacterium]